MPYFNLQLFCSLHYIFLYSKISLKKTHVLRIRFNRTLKTQLETPSIAISRFEGCFKNYTWLIFQSLKPLFYLCDYRRSSLFGLAIRDIDYPRTIKWVKIANNNGKYIYSYIIRIWYPQVIKILKTNYYLGMLVIQSTFWKVQNGYLVSDGWRHFEFSE